MTNEELRIQLLHDAMDTIERCGRPRRPFLHTEETLEEAMAFIESCNPRAEQHIQDKEHIQ